MAAYGVAQDDIATVLDIDPKTLTKYYRKELDTAAAEANTKVAGALFSSALGDPDKGIPPNVTAQIFWLKTRARWKEAKDPGDANPAGTTTIIVRGGLPPLIESEPQALPAPAPQATQSSAQAQPGSERTHGPESHTQPAEGSTDPHTRGFGQ